MRRLYVYKLLFESGATYIGQHTQVNKNDGYITSSSYYRRHPEDKLIERQILIDNICDRDTLNILETICICKDKAENERNVNYNLGGWLSPHFAGWNEGIPASEEQKRKTSKKLKGKTPWNKGKKLSEEHKKRIAENSAHISGMKGKKITDEVKQKMSDAHKGKAHSDEWNKKVGDSGKGIVWWTNGEINKKSRLCPGEGFVRGYTSRR